MDTKKINGCPGFVYLKYDQIRRQYHSGSSKHSIIIILKINNNCNYPMTRSVRRWVGWSVGWMVCWLVCHNSKRVESYTSKLPSKHLLIWYIYLIFFWHSKVYCQYSEMYSCVAVPVTSIRTTPVFQQETKTKQCSLSKPLPLFILISISSRSLSISLSAFPS